ncbi:hypothetical protein HYV74_04955 [Candidatus Uhrbacteria bacterium]|nr:hypothetical protein [Candidatus Uhrbacteria bacterium]
MERPPPKSGGSLRVRAANVPRVVIFWQCFAVGVRKEFDRLLAYNAVFEVFDGVSLL